MGGGDLNLKKSWHPSTMKNMEKVWKAEQQDHEEKKKIAQLKRELELERSKEEMISYARDQGVIEQKGDKKLDWMYTGPNNSVNKEEYLLGKPVDKAFEESEQMKKDLELNRAPKNHVEHECIPPSLRNFSGTEQIDLARKLQEDPLFAIKKKEMESKAQLLKNPVRLKHLKQLLEKQSKGKTSSKKSKKKDKKHKSKDDSDSDEELNALLASQYKKLKGKVSAQDLLKNLEKKKKHKKREKVSSSESSTDSSDSSDDSKNRKKKRKNRSPSRERKSERSESKKSRSEKDHQESRDREKSDDHHRKNRESYKESKCRERSRSPKFQRERERRNYGLVKADGSKLAYNPRKSWSPERKSSSSRKKEEKRWVPPKREKLSQEEKEKRMKEMMENASWRDKERTKNVKRSREEDKRELSQQGYSKDFMRTHLAVAVGSTSLESRIKSKVHSLQRSSYAMDSNFAKR